MRSSRKIFNNLDYTLLICVILASIIGFVAINSATATLDNHFRLMIVQLCAFFIGLIAMTVVILIDYKVYDDLKFIIFAISIILLTTVLIIGFGREDTGTQGWISLGVVNFQPSEFVKICFILTFAAHISRVKNNINLPRNVLMLLLHLAAIVGLILLQPDFGTALVFVAIAVVMLFFANLNKWYFLSAAGLGIIVAPIAWFFIFTDVQRNRFKAFFNPELDPLGSGYHVIQSKIAAGSGQLFGKGYMQGSQTQFGYLPEKQTDFIFSVIGEEFGFIGTLIVTVILLLIVYRCFANAKYAKDTLGEMICCGAGAMLLFHVFENIGMCIGLLPVTGIPLPFISYGGSSMITCLILVGLVESVRLQRRPMSFLNKI